MSGTLLAFPAGVDRFRHLAEGPGPAGVPLDGDGFSLSGGSNLRATSGLQSSSFVGNRRGSKGLGSFTDTGGSPFGPMASSRLRVLGTFSKGQGMATRSWSRLREKLSQ
jgi:hypothetical protein